MSATEEIKKPAEAKLPAPAKEKKTKAAPKEKKAKVSKTAAHPTYFEMIKAALLALKEKSGSSPYAIAKYMEEKYKGVLPANFRKILGLQLKNSATKQKLIKIKASYKLSESGKKAIVVKPAKKKTATTAAAPKKPKPAAKAPAAAAKKAKSTKKPATAAAGTKRKAEAVKKKVAVKKGGKKATPAKAKQPKSIKSPAAKRARRATAA